MSFDNILNTTNSEQLLDDVINNAEADGIQNPAPADDIIFETESPDFGAETENDFYQDTEIIEDEAEEMEPEPEPMGTATIESPTNESFDDDFLSDQDKKRNFLYCQLYVLMMGEGAELLCKIIAGEFGEEAGKKYAVSKTKQNEIARAWAEILNLEMSKKSPKSALIMLIVANFMPLVFMAVKTRFQKNKNKKAEEVQRKAKKYKKQVEETRAEIVEEVEPEKVVIRNKTRADFIPVDEKQTAKVREDQTKSPEPAKENKTTKKKKRGRKKGSAKNPNTGKYEPFSSIEIGKNNKSYYLYSWGERKIVPKSHRQNG